MNYTVGMEEFKLIFKTMVRDAMTRFKNDLVSFSLKIVWDLTDKPAMVVYRSSAWLPWIIVL
jgi:hypothetical protein